MPVFTWFPDANVDRSVKPNVEVANFGDGYEQRVPIGLNTTKEVWSLTFTGSQAKITEIDDFLSARNSVESFEWVTPYSRTGRFVCREWRTNRHRGVLASLTADFEEVFEL